MRQSSPSSRIPNRGVRDHEASPSHPSSPSRTKLRLPTEPSMPPPSPRGHTTSLFTPNYPEIRPISPRPSVSSISAIRSPRVVLDADSPSASGRHRGYQKEAETPPGADLSSHSSSELSTTAPPTPLPAETGSAVEDDGETYGWTLEDIESRVVVKEIENKGRCLFTKSAFQSGEIIYIEAPVMVAIPSLDPQLWATLERLHQEEPLELPPIWHFAAISSLQLLEPEKLRLCYEKWVPEPDKEPSKDVMRVIISGGLKDISPWRYERLLMVWRFNSFGHHTETDGLVLYNRTSMMAHSCTATCCWNYSDGDTYVLRARRVLDAGDELTISYIGDDDIFKSTEIRRDKLRSWLFTCQCDRCQRPLDLARGFRCNSCAAGTCWFKTESDDTIEAAPCTVCSAATEKPAVEMLVSLEALYAERLNECESTDLEDLEAVYAEAIKVFTSHWILFALDTMMFEGYRNECRYEEATYHQHRRLSYLNKVVPQATYSLAWTNEELSDLLGLCSDSEFVGKISGPSDENNPPVLRITPHKKMLLSITYSEAFHLLCVLCGEDHEHSTSVQRKLWGVQNCKILKEDK